MFNQIASSSNKAQTSKSKTVVIEELNPDHEGEKEDKGSGDVEILSGSSRDPSVEHPVDGADDWKNEDVDYKNQHSKEEGKLPQAHSFGFQTCRGHSCTRKLNSDGKVDTLQTLHNLNEEELAGFEEAWIGNANKRLPGWNEGFDTHHNASSIGVEQKERTTWGGWALPLLEQSRNAGAMLADNEARTSSANGGKPKKIVRINID